MNARAAELPVTTDVLVVGAGPTGLALATALRRAGVEPLVVDAAAGISSQTRAAGVQPRTLEQLARLDAADELVARGIKGEAFAAVTPQQTLLRIPFGGLDTPYPFVLLVPQDITERVLADALHRSGGTVARRHRVVWAVPEFDAVTVAIADPDGVLHIVRARYVVGCDGLHSGMRGRAEIDFAGEQDTQDFLLADVTVAESAQAPEVTFCFSPDGLLVMSPLPGSMLRLVATVDAAADPAPPAGGTRGMDVAAAQRLIDRRGPGRASWKVTDVARSSPYRVSTRVAARFRAGRIFLAGDAAHVHSPAGGQGMNTGIQDGLNLAWKLAAVLRTGAPDALLDSYDAERRPNAAALLAFTRQLTSLAELTDPATRQLRDQMLVAAGRDDLAPGFLARQLAQLDVTAGPRPASPGTSGLVPGQRVPPAGTWSRELRWSVLVPSPAQGTAADVTAGTDVMVGSSPAAQALLVRPDGYLAAISSGLEREDLLRLLHARISWTGVNS